MKSATLSVLVVSILLTTATAEAQTPAHLWSQHFGGSSIDLGNSVAVDASGNVFMAGSFEGTVNFGGGPLVSAGMGDIVVAKYSPDGTHLWSQRFGSTGNDIGYSLATDASGNVFMTGSFTGAVDFGGGAQLNSAGGADIVVAKYSPTGTHLWSQRFGGTGTDVGYSLATDASGNVLLTGYFSGTAFFGSALQLVSAGLLDIVVARYSPTGTYLWSQRFGSTGDDKGQSVATDASGNVFMTGVFTGTVNFGGGALVSAGANEIIVAKYSPTGTHLWSQRFGSTLDDAGLSVATDASGNVFMMGFFQGTVAFGGGALVSAGSTDMVVAKYGPTGTHLWSQRFGSTSNDFASSVAADASGNVFMTGYFQGTVNFGGGNLVSAGLNDIVVAKYSPTGTHLWSQRFGSTSADIGSSVATDASGNVFMMGYFNGVVDFGGGALVSAGSYDIVVAKYAADSAEPLITSIADIGNDQGRKVKIRFDRSGHDQAGSTPILQYEAYRRDDAPPASSVAWDDPAALSIRQLLADGWTQVGSVAAHGDPTYGIDVPTIGDSTLVLGQYYSAFFLRAATATPTIFFASPMDSGYSVDNLAPGVPSSFAYNAGMLSWNESPAADFDYFTVYGANIDAFGFATVVDYTVTLLMDVTASPYTYYFVTATDFSGNEGNPAKINTAAGVGGTPQSYVLSVSNFPNPFNPRTTVSYTVPSRGNVTVAIYDARGALVAMLVNNESRETGAYRMDWNGQADSGAAVSSGVYFARIEQAGAIKTKKMVLLK